MNGFQKLHDQQDEFIKKTLQEDKLISQPMFDSFSNQMNQTKIKVKKYSYKQQKIIIVLLLLLTVSVGLNFYLAIVKDTPITITNIFEPAKDKSSSDKDKINNLPDEDTNQETTIPENTTSDENNIQTSNNQEETTNTISEVPSDITTQEPVNTTITPVLFPEINTNEVEDFVDQFAIGINKLKLEDNSNLESNTVLLYIAQQYFLAKANTSNSLNVDASYASSTENFHKFLSEFTINDYSTIDYLKSYNNYIGYVSRSKSYVYGSDYSTLAKEKYNCEDVTITNEENNIYTAKAKVTRTYEGEESTYEVTFTFKINANYKYQKYKLLSFKSKITSSNIDNAIHLVGN